MKYALVLVFIFSATLVRSQTCTGGLGDPITNITFGAGANYGPPLASGITNLSYISDQCPNDGSYTITHSSSGCFEGTWVNLSSDHTGDPNGYFMLINASYNPSDFYVQTVSGLCAATKYQFAAWVMNLSANSGLILPNISLSIEKTDGTLLDSIHTGNIPQANPGKWIQYGFFFTTPPGINTVVLRMTNNAPGGNGNDLALDDITFRPAGPPVSVTLNGLATDSVTICAGSATPQLLQGSVGDCYSSPTYQWQQSTDGQTWADIPGAVSLSYPVLPSAAGAYLYRLAAAQSGNISISSCKVASPPSTIVVLKIPDPAVTISASSDNICAGAPAAFTALPADGGNTPLYQWTINGIPVSTAGPAYSSSSFVNADQVSCTMTSDAACVIDPVAASNIISMTVTPIVVSSVNIAASAITICSDSLVTFTAIPANGGSDPTYQWMVNGQLAGTNADVFSSATLQDGDVVSVVMLGSLYCSVPETSNSIPMTVYPVPQINMPPDTIITAGSSIRLDPLITGQILFYQWSPITWLDLPGSPDPVATPATTTTYQLTVTTGNGCVASGKETVGVYYDLLMPGAFSPNGDGRNDLFRIPPSVPVSILRFSVYDRWGELVFTTSNSGAGWDGRMGNKPQPAGVYVWMIDYINPLTKRSARKNGTVTLIR
ncbi:MAG TPA: gliding motility-associated C-terminal domain-containing protein [Puia sp.]|nr:gliding motility-associated C-terminal domain-containing protein [Puia sp.]